MARQPTRADAWGPEQLEPVLRQKHPDARVAAVVVAEHARCGDGVASTADRVALDVRYAGGDDGLPERIMLKTLLLHPAARLGPPGCAYSVASYGAQAPPARREHDAGLVFRAVALYQDHFPQAPDAMYENEVRFYRELRDTLDIEAPATYGTLFERDGGHFAVLMEDLRRRGARFPNALGSLELDTVRSGLRNLAKVHASHYRAPTLDTDLAWLPTSRSGGMHEVFDEVGLELIRDQVARNPFKEELIAPLGADVDELWELLWRAQDRLAGRPQTLLHGDTHVANTYVVPTPGGDQSGLLDWQLMMRGTPMQDVTYYITTALDVDARREHEAALIGDYRDALITAGIEDAPTFDELLDDHRVCAIWGLVIGWLITPPQNYGVPITAANIERTATLMRDMDTIGCLR